MSFLKNIPEKLDGIDKRLPDIRKHPSWLVIIFIACFSALTMDFWRPYNQNDKGHNFYWDVFGYYSYLPAYFCNGGSMEVGGALADYNPPGPLGTHVPKYTYGTSVMYAPFFALGYKVAYNTNGPLDGFSAAFIQCIHWSTLVYVLIGLLFLRSLLKKYFTELVVAITLTAAFFGTMVFYYTLSQAEMTHGYLFSLYCVFLWLVERWHAKTNWTYTFWIGFVSGLITLIRPTEIIVVLFFVLWQVRSLADIKAKALFFYKHSPKLLLIACIAAAWWIPQLLFYKKHAGTYFYFSYMRERFFWTDPQIINVLFSYRKGWITYTPMVLLALIGIGTVKKEFPVSKWSFFAVTALLIYVLSCWWDWNYGGCFGARSFCQYFAVLSIPFAYLLQYIIYELKSKALQASLASVLAIYICSALFLNMGMSYQYNTAKKIHPWGMSKNNYWRVIRTYQFSDAENAAWWKDLNEPDFIKYSDGTDRNQ